MKKVIIRYFVIGIRPIKFIQLDDNILSGAAYAMDWEDGKFKISQNYVDNIWGRQFKDDAEEITQIEFDNLVDEYRLERNIKEVDDTEFNEGMRYYTDVLAKS